MKNYQSKLFQNFKNHDRFDYPDDIVRVTAGYGGESLLIFGEEKTVLYDCGMAYCAEGLIENIQNALAERGRDGLDDILLSHTHYDHIGALPYLLKMWPEALVVGAEKAGAVFQSEGARRTMKRLSENARDQFTDSREPISVDGLRLDLAVKTGNRIALGADVYVEALETKGHTDCTMSYILRPRNLLFSSESTGVLHGPGQMHTAILKSYEDTMKSAEISRNCGAEQIISPHYGILPKGYVDEFFDLYIQSAEEERDYILNLYDQGLDIEQIMAAFEARFWTEERAKGQPKAAFLENAGYTIRHIVYTFRQANI